ncbi:hypothetical protein [Lysobacter enzymogenes]|uniref:Uncharacterized protein n=1 Tax=Lysobacter enzymogenes TaxID=69 RepID=A0A3N2RDC7_LYSEN|nr:hypothetical protein [Lysobacter enzymogenes]ROU05445.1 hypothetical protein D9T17_18695 [Lysobacter enzymogenes]
MAERLIDEFIEKWLELSLRVRQKDGLDEALHEELIELLGRIKAEWAGQERIPKRLADVFLDMWGALTSCADSYDEDARRTIYVAADHLVFHAREICWS